MIVAVLVSQLVFDDRTSLWSRFRNQSSDRFIDFTTSSLIQNSCTKPNQSVEHDSIYGAISLFRQIVQKLMDFGMNAHSEFRVLG